MENDGPKLSLVAPLAAPDADAPSSAALETGVVITDAKGRHFKLKQPSLLQESHLMRALGEHSSNAAYVGAYVMPAAMVIEMDGVELEFPQTPRMVDAAIQRLGREGMAAVMAHLLAIAEVEKSREGAPGDLKK